MFSDDELKGLAMPSIVFAGQKDIMIRSDETIERSTKLLPRTEIVNLPEHGHSLSGFGNEIAAFLKRH